MLHAYNDLVAQLQQAVRQQCKCESQDRVAEVTHWGPLAFRNCRQFRILGAQDLACALICRDAVELRYPDSVAVFVELGVYPITRALSYTRLSFFS